MINHQSLREVQLKVDVSRPKESTALKNKRAVLTILEFPKRLHFAALCLVDDDQLSTVRREQRSKVVRMMRET